jgi:glutaredoxin
MKGHFMKIRNAFVLMIFILGSAQLPVQAQIYSWVDAKGVTHYSDEPPADGKAVLNVKTVDVSAAGGESYTGPQPVSGQKTEVQPAAARKFPGVKMYTTQWCPACKQVKAWFKANKVPFQEVDVEASAENRAQFRALGGKDVPLVLVGKNRMEGFDEATVRGWLSLK